MTQGYRHKPIHYVSFYRLSNMMAGHNEAFFSWQQCKSNQRMAQYRAMGERNNILSPSKEGSN